MVGGVNCVDTLIFHREGTQSIQQREHRTVAAGAEIFRIPLPGGAFYCFYAALRIGNVDRDRKGLAVVGNIIVGEDFRRCHIVSKVVDNGALIACIVADIKGVIASFGEGDCVAGGYCGVGCATAEGAEFPDAECIADRADTGTALVFC